MRYFVILAVSFFIMFPAVGFSDTINIPADYSTIQKGIDAAVKGDTVLVAPGTYVENIDFNGKAITVASSKGAKVTVIDGGSPINPDFGSVVKFESGEGSSSVLAGFTLTNGTGTYIEWSPGNVIYLGGGIYCNGASPLIINNIIKNNDVETHPENGSGGGLFCFKSSLVLANI